MERVTTKEAAKLLNMDVVTLQFLMRQERLPMKKSWNIPHIRIQILLR